MTQIWKRLQTCVPDQIGQDKMTLPRSHFPETVSPHGEHRALFAGYGTLGGVEVKGQRGNAPMIISQRNYQNNSERFVASSPTLPLFMPNEG